MLGAKTRQGASAFPRCGNDAARLCRRARLHRLCPLVSPNLRPLLPVGVRTWLSVLAVLLAVSLRAFAQSAPPVRYYDTGIGKTGGTLKGALHEIIKGHTVLPYTSTSTDTWDAVMMLDEDPLDSASVVLIYSGLTNLKTNNYTGGVGVGKWDREHLFPQSFGLVALSASSRAKTDVFNLRPIEYTVNSTRNNLFYDTTTTPFHTMAGAPGSSYDSDSWEPREEDKGIVARAAFYMATRYDGTDADVPDLELSDTPDAATYHFGKLSTLRPGSRLIVRRKGTRSSGSSAGPPWTGSFNSGWCEILMVCTISLRPARWSLITSQSFSPGRSALETKWCCWFSTAFRSANGSF